MPTDKTKARSRPTATAKSDGRNDGNGASGIRSPLIASGRVGSVPQLIFGDLWEYDPAPETADPKLKSKYDLFIGGKFVAPKSGKYFDSINPANETKLAEIAHANAADVDAAYAAAKKAYDTTWGKLPGRER